jgi:hypothetical protein
MSWIILMFFILVPKDRVPCLGHIAHLGAVSNDIRSPVLN